MTFFLVTLSDSPDTDIFCIFIVGLNAKILLNFARKIEECSDKIDEGIRDKMPHLVPFYVKLDGEGVQFKLPEFIKTDVQAILKCSANTALMREAEVLFGGDFKGFEVKKLYVDISKFYY